MTKIIDNVISYAKSLKNKGFSLDYQHEIKSGLVQIYVDMERKGIVVVSGPPEVIKTIMESIENN